MASMWVAEDRVIDPRVPPAAAHEEPRLRGERDALDPERVRHLEQRLHVACREDEFNDFFFYPSFFLALLNREAHKQLECDWL